MTEAQLRGLFKLWQTRLGLGTWKIGVEFAECGRECHDIVLMETHRPADYDTATIQVQPFALTGDIPEGWVIQPLTDEYLEIKVVHELLHCVMRDMRFCDVSIDGQLHRDVDAAWQIVQKRAEEQTVDRLATALVKAFGQKGRKRV